MRGLDVVQALRMKVAREDRHAPRLSRFGSATGLRPGSPQEKDRFDWGRLLSGSVLCGIYSYICGASWPLSCCYFRNKKMSLEMPIRVTCVCCDCCLPDYFLEI